MQQDPQVENVVATDFTREYGYINIRRNIMTIRDTENHSRVFVFLANQNRRYDGLPGDEDIVKKPGRYGPGWLIYTSGFADSVLRRDQIYICLCKNTPARATACRTYN